MPTVLFLNFFKKKFNLVVFNSDICYLKANKQTCYHLTDSYFFLPLIIIIIMIIISYLYNAISLDNQ